MTPQEFFDLLASADFDKLPMSISLGMETRLRINASDITAGKLLIWLIDALPEDATVRQAEEVLADAAWWLKFWASICEPIDEPDQESEHDNSLAASPK